MKKGRNIVKIIPIQNLLIGYVKGIFPMSDARSSEDVQWYTAEKRGIIPLDKFHVSSNVRRIIRQQRYDVKIDRNFRKTMEHCADRQSTWISDVIIESYTRLHEAGYAHSVEIYDDDRNMVGGLYGVSLKSAFFGESMFNKEPETAKIALYYCHKILETGGFKLWDTQYYTHHLAQFGCVEVPQEEYMYLLDKALSKEANFDSSGINRQ